MMQSATPLPRRELGRSLTWPQTIHGATAEILEMYEDDQNFTSAMPTTKPHHSLFEDDLDNNPENHFLSPTQMYEYDDWADDSDSDADEVEWDAGITDFALFDNERRRAQESNKSLSSKWVGMLEQQTSALACSVQRKRTESNLNRVRGPLPAPEEEIPSLTPDVSPNLRDDLDSESYHGHHLVVPSVPNYLTITITPPEDDDEALDEDDEPLSFYVTPRRLQPEPKRKPERPGLRHNRTMSGHVHAWRRPSMYTVGEDVEAEERAEQGCSSEDENENRYLWH